MSDVKIVKRNGLKIKVITSKNLDKYLSEEDKEMDFRAKKAVEAAIEKAIVCKKPIAKYDEIKKKAYIEYPNGVIKYSN